MLWSMLQCHSYVSTPRSKLKVKLQYRLCILLSVHDSLSPSLDDAHTHTHMLTLFEQHWVNMSHSLKYTWIHFFALLFCTRIRMFLCPPAFLYLTFLFFFLKNYDTFVLTLCSIALQCSRFPSSPLRSLHPGLPGYGYPGITSPLPPAPALRNA